MNSSLWMIVAAAVLWSLNGLFGPLLDTLSGATLAFWRAVFASLILLPTIRRVQWSPWLIPMTLSFAAMNYVFLTALVEADPSATIWLQHTAPAWVALLGLLFFGERPGPGDGWLLLLALSGVALILSFELQGAAPRGVIFGLLSGVTYSFVVLSMRRLRGFDPSWLVALSHLAVVVIFCPVLTSDAMRPAGGQWLLLAAFGMIQMALPYVLFARALQTVGSIQASGILLLEPLLVPLWVFLVRGTLPRPWVVGGAALILCGLALQLRARGRHAASL